MTGYKSKKLLAQSREDDLVKRLREYCDGNNDLMDAAADRIEKQQEYIEAYQDQTNVLLTCIDLLKTALQMPRSKGKRDE
jgi:LmbE family N-acetylglucosaminyl deacetylase